MQIDDPTPHEKLKCTVHTFVRPLDKFSPNFVKEAKVNTTRIDYVHTKRTDATEQSPK